MDPRQCDYRVGLNPSCPAHSYYQGFYYTSIAISVLSVLVLLSVGIVRVGGSTLITLLPPPPVPHSLPAFAFVQNLAPPSEGYDANDLGSYDPGLHR